MTDTDSYAPQTRLVEVLGDHSKPRILAALLSDPATWHTKSDLAQLAGVSTRTISRQITPLESHSVIETKPSKRGYTVYRINKDSPVAECLAEFEWSLLEES